LAYLDKIHEKEKALSTRINYEEEKEKETGMEEEEEGKLIQVNQSNVVSIGGETPFIPFPSLASSETF
jgi:hypothetical protein